MLKPISVSGRQNEAIQALQMNLVNVRIRKSSPGASQIFPLVCRDPSKLRHVRVFKTAQSLWGRSETSADMKQIIPTAVKSHPLSAESHRLCSCGEQEAIRHQRGYLGCVSTTRLRRPV